MRRENLVGRRETFLAFMNVQFFIILTNSLDSIKCHFQTKKFEVRRESLKKILVRRGWKKSARHCSIALNVINLSRLSYI